MFRKSGPSAGKDLLADRVRQLAERKAQPDFEKASQRKAKERAPRQPLFRHGVLILEGEQRLSVAIKDFSATGARVEFFVNMVLPSEVVLAEPTLNIRSLARVVWQRDGVAGLQFIER